MTIFLKNVNIILVLERRTNILCGYYSKEDTPVTISNTEVKLFSADGTWGGDPLGEYDVATWYAEVAELADAQDLKSCGTYLSYRFDSGLRHHI